MSPKLTFNHFSHIHPLELSNFDEVQNQASCSACNLNASEWVCICKKCNYILHFQCSIAPKQIQLPFHRDHVLSLLHERSYFNCYACGQLARGFSYSCTPCKVDLHINCVKSPLVLIHKSHPRHPLELITTPRPPDRKRFTCSICIRDSTQNWLYQCHMCHFHVHVSCATKAPVVASGTSHPNPSKRKEEKEKKNVGEITEEQRRLLYQQYWDEQYEKGCPRPRP